MKWERKGCSWHGEDKNGDSRERVSDFSLEIHAIGPLDFDGARRAKRSTRSRLRVDPGFASFDKLQEVGVSPYLCFIPIFNCFSMFRLV